MARLPRITFPLFLLALSALALGCGGEEPAERQVYRVRGELLGTAEGGQSAVIRHDSIPGYMSAMTMPFRLEDPAALDGLTTGDSVAFDLVVEGGSATITALERLPSDTARTPPQDTSGSSPAVP